MDLSAFRLTPVASRPGSRAVSVSLLLVAAFGLSSAAPARAQLKPAKASVWHQGTPGVEGAFESGDLFGYAVALGDFNCDGRLDLATGAPGEDTTGGDSAGAVNVIYQGADGLLTGGIPDQIWEQGSAGIPTVGEDHDLWGSALAAGDFNADGCADLAIAAIGEGVGAIADAGAVTVLYGSASGLVASGVQSLHQDANDAVGTPLPASATAFAQFGYDMATGDFDGDGFDDLAVGIPNGIVPLGADDDPGTVQVLYGSAAGLRVRPGSGSGYLSMATFGEDLGAHDRFGHALVAADFDQDGDDDLAIGIPERDADAATDAGDFVVVAGSPAGLGAATLPLFFNAILAVMAQSDASLGTDLAAGDVDGDGFPDLLLSSPGQLVSGSPRGRVLVLYGEAGGLRHAAPPRRGSFHAAELGLESFGYRLTAGDFDASGHVDVAAGAMSEDLPLAAGALAISYADGKGPAYPTSSLWQGHQGLPGSPAPEEVFGFALATGDLTGDGVDDLVVGTPADSPSGIVDAGTVTVIPGAVPTCIATDTTSCLADGRFAVSVDWATGNGDEGVGHVIPTGPSGVDDSGLFWFFAPTNWELLVKVVDGCGFNGNFWVFSAATTNVEYTLTVTDTETGVERTYVNPLGDAAQALADTEAFATCGSVTSASAASAAAELASWSAEHGVAATPAVASFDTRNVQEHSAELDYQDEKAMTAACVPSETTRCLGDGRFSLHVNWRTAEASGNGVVVNLGSDDSGLFWFFAEENWELLVKVLDGCGINQRFWVFSAATTDVEYELVVRDTVTGAAKTYRNEMGTLARAVTDTDAFAGCGAAPTLKSAPTNTP